MIDRSLNKLIKWIEREGYKGYDPYDYLLSSIFSSLDNLKLKFYVQQFGKRNPINIRKFLRIEKDYNPKGLALIALGYINLYKITHDEAYLLKAKRLINILYSLRCREYSNYSWGYNFPWVSRSWIKKNFYLPSFHPSVVVSSTVGNMLVEYYNITNDEKVLNVILSIKEFILNNINRYETDKYLCFSYTPYDHNRIFNASLMATEFLSNVYKIDKDNALENIIKKSVKYVIDEQNPDGSWIYGYEDNGTNLIQYDFHQGFILTSLNKIADNLNLDVTYHIKSGLAFYKNFLFDKRGISLYRYPKKYPIDIHNQAQGIIAFSILGDLRFANKIAKWTIAHMQDPSGYFYYQRWPFLINKIPYIRWGQAWMFVALTTIYVHNKNQGGEIL